MINDNSLSPYLHDPFVAQCRDLPPCKGGDIFDHRKVGNEYIQQSVA